jgi:hypothetical protein
MTNESNSKTAREFWARHYAENPVTVEQPDFMQTILDRDRELLIRAMEKTPSIIKAMGAKNAVEAVLMQEDFIMGRGSLPKA